MKLIGKDISSTKITGRVGDSKAEELANLWNRVVKSDEQAFSELYYLTIKPIATYCARITGDKELINDCIQDLFVELWGSRSSLPKVEAVKFYLFKRIKRKIIKRLVMQRKLPLSNNILEQYDFEIVFSRETELEQLQITKERREKLLNAINTLTRRQKEALTLRVYDGLTHEEIGSLLEMSAKSARNLIYRAMLSLRKEMLLTAILLLFTA